MATAAPTTHTQRATSRLQQMSNDIEKQLEAGHVTAVAAGDILDQIANALERIDVGKYGVCEACDEPIDPARLAGIPYATQCARCRNGGSVNGFGGPSTNGSSEREARAAGSPDAHRTASPDTAPPPEASDTDSVAENNTVPHPGVDHSVITGSASTHGGAANAASEEAGGVSNAEGDAQAEPEPRPVRSDAEDVERAGAATPPQLAPVASPGPTHAGVEYLPVDMIDFEPDRDMGDVYPLARSIIEVGLLQPIVVRPSDEGGPLRYKIIVGRRRFTAVTKIIGWEEIPAIVRSTIGAQEAAAAALIENLHRKDISPLEEARGYQRLVKEFGLAQRDVAERVARGQGTVSKRIALLDLPAEAIDALDSSRITLEEAHHLLKLREHPKRMNGVWSRYVASKEHGTWFRSFEEEVASELAEIKRADTRKKTIEDLEKKGVKVLDAPPSNYYANKSAKKVPLGRDTGMLPVAPKQHADEPCHAAWIDNYSGKPKYACTDAKRHATKGKSELKADRVGYGSTQPTLDEHATRRQRSQLIAEQLRKAEGVRKLFLKKALAGKVSLDDATDLLLAFLARPISMGDILPEMDLGSVAELLGVQPKHSDWPATAAKLDAYVKADRLNRARAIAAHAADLFESDLIYFGNVMDDPGATELWTGARPYYDFLTRHGYELSDIERELLEQPTSPEEDSDANAAAAEGEGVDG